MRVPESHTALMAKLVAKYHRAPAHNWKNVTVNGKEFRVADVRVGDRFVDFTQHYYHQDGESQKHTLIALVEITGIDGLLADYKVIKRLHEDGRPDWQTAVFAGWDRGGFSMQFVRDEDDNMVRVKGRELTAKDVAHKFAEELLKELGLRTMRRVVKLNAAEGCTSVCHSHDFCDANMTMLRAFERCGISDVMGNEDRFPLWNEAWALAVKGGFWLPAPKSRPGRKCIKCGRVPVEKKGIAGRVLVCMCPSFRPTFAKRKAVTK